MSNAAADAIVNGLLYEGYTLYPSEAAEAKTPPRPAAAGLCPQTYSLMHPDEPSAMLVECLVEGTGSTRIDLRIGFLHVIERRVHVVQPPTASWPAAEPVARRDVEMVEVDGVRYDARREATEHTLPLPSLWLGELFCAPVTLPFKFAAREDAEPLRDRGGQVVATLTRVQQTLEGNVRVSCVCVGTGLFRLIVKIVNTTAMPPVDIAPEAATPWTLASCHAVLRTNDGSFVSLFDPPERLKRAASACRNIGAWPVLVGDEGAHDTLLASPVILDDYPQRVGRRREQSLALVP